MTASLSPVDNTVTQDWQIKPVAVPTTSGGTVVQDVDCYLKTVVVINTTGGAITFTLADQQTIPVDVLAAVSIAANTTMVIAFPEYYWCPGGFTVIAGSAGLNFYAAWKQ